MVDQLIVCGNISLKWRGGKASSNYAKCKQYGNIQLDKADRTRKHILICKNEIENEFLVPLKKMKLSGFQYFYNR